MPNEYPINIRAIDHVVIQAADLEKMVAFYCDVLGCRLERGPGDLGLAQLRAGNSLIDILDLAGPLGRPAAATQEAPWPARAHPNMDHFCVQVEPWDLAAIQAHLRRHGVLVGDPATRYGARGEGPSLYIEDPEGNRVELKGPPAG